LSPLHHLPNLSHLPPPHPSFTLTSPSSKVQQKTFIANVTTQVIERHIVTGLENLFEPFVVSQLSDLAVQAMASEPAATKRMRDFYENKIMKLREGEEIFRSVV